MSATPDSTILRLVMNITSKQEILKNGKLAIPCLIWAPFWGGVLPQDIVLMKIAICVSGQTRVPRI